MKNLDGHLFLLSLMLLPACASRRAGDDDDSSNELGDGCKSFVVRYTACFRANDGFAGYAYTSSGYVYTSSGYAYTTSGGYGYTTSGDSYDSANDETGYDYDPEEYCNSLIGYYREAYGRGCAAAVDEVFACLARQDCEALTGADSDAQEFCRRELNRVEDVCDG